MNPKLEIRLPQDIIDALRERAKAKGETLSDHVRGILSRSLKVKIEVHQGWEIEGLAAKAQKEAVKARRRKSSE